MQVFGIVWNGFGKCGVWLGRLTFTSLLIMFMLPVAALALAMNWYQHRTSSNHLKSTVGQFGFCSQLIIGMVVLAWRAVLFLSFWIRLDVHGLDTFRGSFGSSGRPCVLLMNHTSFMDSILAVSLTPLAQAVCVRGLMSSHLFRAPVLGSLLRAMGQIEVPFEKDGANGGFQVNKELMDARMLVLEQHLQQGGNTSWYPEGTINKNPRTLQKFRAGGFVLPLKVDTEIWCMAFVGNQESWPRGSILGGAPARIGVKVWRVCESSYEFQAAHNDLLETECTDDKGKAISWARLLEREFQKAVDELVAQGFCCGSSPDQLPASKTL